MNSLKIHAIGNRKQVIYQKRPYSQKLLWRQSNLETVDFLGNGSNVFDDFFSVKVLLIVVFKKPKADSSKKLLSD